MAQEATKQFYRSKAWQECRAGYLASKQHLCEECRKAGKLTPAEIVHHKKILTADNVTDPETTLSWSNLEAVCQECHNKIHATKKRYRIINGILIINDD